MSKFDKKSVKEKIGSKKAGSKKTGSKRYLPFRAVC
jgi:hypothetical protein